MTKRRRLSEVTLTELMVALAVMIIVASQVMLSYTSQHEKSQSHERVVESQEEVRLITDVILNDLRMAGFMVHETAGIGSGDGGTTGADTICVSDPKIAPPQAVPVPAHGPPSARFDSNSQSATVSAPFPTEIAPPEPVHSPPALFRQREAMPVHYTDERGPMRAGAKLRRSECRQPWSPVQAKELGWRSPNGLRRRAIP